MIAAVANGWFAMGMSSRDNSATFFITFDGWAQANPPSLFINYEYVTPVELTSFAATTDNKNVNLNWSTATELNNSGFQVERSSGSEYQVVGFVAGHGTTTEVQNYSYSDKNVDAGTYTYRLKQVDFDGTFEYSNAIEVEVLGVKEFALGQNYPNPFNPSTKINFSLAVDSKVSLKIFDVLGQEVATLINGQLAAGSQEVSFNASSLNSGVYFYRIDASGIDGQKFSSVKKMILTK
ncbi:MAG: T9SS type A sorting domain-containing protein [Ignavibacteriales bacterium]|nr:T9SS type A sorting domain-containing protein [Ignavibacteriales bacterium]